MGCRQGAAAGRELHRPALRRPGTAAAAGQLPSLRCLWAALRAGAAPGPGRVCPGSGFAQGTVPPGRAGGGEAAEAACVRWEPGWQSPPPGHRGCSLRGTF